MTTEEDVTEECKNELQQTLARQVLFAEQDVVFRLADVYCNGKATTKSQGGHTSLHLELVVLMGWECRARDKSVEGKISIGSLSNATIDTPPLEIGLNEAPKEEAATRVLIFMRTRGKAKLLDLLEAFWDRLRARFGPRCLTGLDDGAGLRRELARQLVTWMRLNMLTSLRLAWLSSKALAARTLITGLMTAGGAFMLGGPLGLTAVGAFAGGGFGGYKGWQQQRENFGEFYQAFQETDRVMLVDMMGRFLETPAGKEATLDRWERWVQYPENQRALLVHFCKELSDDSAGGAGAPLPQQVVGKVRQYCCAAPPTAVHATAPAPAAPAAPPAS